MAVSASVPAIDMRQAKAGRAAPGRVIALVVLLSTAYAPLVSVYVRQIWLRPHYQFFPLVLVGSAVLALSRLPGLGQLKPGSWRWSYGLAGLALALTAIAVFLFSSWLGAIALLLTLAATIFGIGGGMLLRRLLPAWGFLWLAIPPPFE